MVINRGDQERFGGERVYVWCVCVYDWPCDGKTTLDPKLGTVGTSNHIPMAFLNILPPPPPKWRHHNKRKQKTEEQRSVYMLLC